MPRSPPPTLWKSFAEAESDRDYLLLLTHLPVRRLSRLPLFLRYVRITAGLNDDTQAGTIASLEGRTIHPTATVPEALDTMKRTERRRLAVVGDDGALLGLLCVKASGRGFCSDADVRNRANAFGRAV
jgi:hypothetical protein